MKLHYADEVHPDLDDSSANNKPCNKRPHGTARPKAPPSPRHIPTNIGPLPTHPTLAVPGVVETTNFYGQGWVGGQRSDTCQYMNRRRGRRRNCVVVWVGTVLFDGIPRLGLCDPYLDEYRSHFDEPGTVGKPQAVAFQRCQARRHRIDIGQDMAERSLRPGH